MTESRSKGNEDRSRDLETRETEKKTNAVEASTLASESRPQRGFGFPLCEGVYARGGG